MKRALASLFVAAAALAPAAPTAIAADIDAQDFLILRQTVENHQTALDTLDGLKRRLAEVESKLAEARRDLGAVRQANATLSKDLVTQDQLKSLVTKLELIDHNRAEDSKRIYETLKKFADAPPVAPPSLPPVDKPNPRTPANDHFTGTVHPPSIGSSESGAKPLKPPVELPAENYEHTVAPDQTMSGILAAYRKEYGLKTTMAHVEAANPGVNPKKLQVGQKLKIPVIK